MIEIKVKWEEENILDTLLPKKKDRKRMGAKLRVYKASKTYSLDHLSDRLIKSIGFKPSDSIAINVLVGFLFLLSIAPFDFKIMKGKGIDAVIDKLKHNEEGKFLYIEKPILEEELYKSDLGIRSMDWFIDNKLFEEKDDMYIFRGNKIKSTQVYQSLD